MSYMISNLGLLIRAIPMTLWLALLSTVFGLLLGVIGALFQIHKTPICAKLTMIYLTIIRGIPALILIYVAYYGLPKFIIAFGRTIGQTWTLNTIPNIVFAVTALAIERSAYFTEMVRSAILSVDAGQMEAAKAVGMTTLQSYRRVIFPQAIVTALPNFGNLFIGAIKGSSLAYVVGVMEITATANIEACRSYRYIELYVAISIIYWVINTFFGQIFRISEKKLSRYKAQA